MINYRKGVTNNLSEKLKKGFFVLRNKVENRVKKKETSFLRKLKRFYFLGIWLLLDGTDQETVKVFAGLNTEELFES